MIVGSRRLLLFLACVAASWPIVGRAQPGALAEPRPTVTVESGDTGGTFFGRAPEAAKTRHYYIAAESVLWDYAPSGRDEICGNPLPPPLVRNRKAGKLRYIQYTDATFTAQVIPNRSLGIMGPVLRGVTGEFLAVTFLNRTDQPLSMHPHGAKYDRDSEGANTFPNPGRGAAVGAGARFTYVWQLDEMSGPAPDEPSSKAWLYHSHVTADTETNLGLVGAIIVTDPKRARPDGTPRDVDREFATLFMIFDESGLDAAAIEAAEYAGLPGLASEAPPLSWAQTQQLLEQGSRAAINGYVFGNLPGLQMNEGERTRWYLFGLGSERDFHTAHWHGLRALEDGRRRTDVIELLPATMKVADLVADNPGTWLFHCHVADHMREGMFSPVVVHARDTVGVSRSPAYSFLGYPPAGQSLRIERAEARSPAAAPAATELVVDGVVTVFDGFAIYNETIAVGIGGRVLTFRPDKTGVARATGAQLRVKNANEFGVVRGGLLEFEIVLSGKDLIAAAGTTTAPTVTEVPRAALAGTAGAATLYLSLDVARGHHVASSLITRKPTSERFAMNDHSATHRRVRHAQGYLGLGMLHEAEAELDSIAAADHLRPEVLSARVDLYMEAKRWEKLVDVGSGLARAHPEIEHAWIAWAYALREINRVAEARAVLLEAESHHGRTSAVLHYNLACYDSLLGAMPSASARLAKACRMDKRFEVEGRQDPDLKPLRDAEARPR